MLTLSNISAGYGGADVIHDISLEINGNVSIVGPNGCGKTTLLKAIAGLLPSRGGISIMGKCCKSMKQRELAKNIAMLSQAPTIYFTYSVFDTVMMGRYLHIKDKFSNQPTKHDKEIVAQSLAAVGLLELKNKEITKLSGGQLQRVFLARALAQQPRIILLDEPTNHLDLKCQIDIIEYLKKWAQRSEQKRAVVGVLHDINLAMLLSDRVIIMENGKIATDDTANNIVRSNILNQVYDMDVTAHMRDSFQKWG